MELPTTCHPDRSRLGQASGDYRDIRYETAEGIAKITICRPEVRNAFRPQTLFELADAFNGPATTTRSA